MNHTAAEKLAKGVTEALRARYGTPQKMFRRLGLDEKVLTSEPPIDEMVTLIGKLLTDNAKLKRGIMANDAMMGADYAEIPEELKRLRDELPVHLPPEVYQPWVKRYDDLIARTRELAEAINSVLNTRANGDDEPPEFPGKPKRDLAQDSFEGRYPMTRRIGINGASPPRQDALEALQRHMSRIGHV